MGLSFGVLILQDRPLDTVLEWARRFDEAGADSVWVADHLSNPHALDEPWLDAWLVLGAVARVTTRCRIGPLVSNFVLHSPLEMARKVHMMNLLSANRFDLGLGAGGAPVDRAFASAQEGSGAELAARLEAGIDSVLSLLRGERLRVPPIGTIAGRSAPPDVCATFAEGPARVPPIVVGGQSNRVIDVAARYGDRWNIFGAGTVAGAGSVSDFAGTVRRLGDQLAERCLAHGRDPATVKRSILLDLLADTTAQTRAALGDVVGRMAELGFEECIAYAWADARLTRSPDELLAFVGEDLPGIRS